MLGGKAGCAKVEVSEADVGSHHPDEEPERGHPGDEDDRGDGEGPDPVAEVGSRREVAAAAILGCRWTSALTVSGLTGVLEGGPAVGGRPRPSR